MRSESSGEKFDRELWTAELNPLLALWKKLNQVHLLEAQLLIFLSHSPSPLLHCMCPPSHATPVLIPPFSCPPPLIPHASHAPLFITSLILTNPLYNTMQGIYTVLE